MPNPNDATGAVPELSVADQLELLRAAVNHQRDAIVITEAERVHPDGRRILYVNHAFTVLTGYSAEEAVGRTPDFTIGPETDRAVIRRLRTALDEVSPTRVDILKYRKDGTRFWVELDLAPVLGRDGRCTCFVAVIRDITDRHQLQQQLLEADRLATLGTLAAGVAHEINNPLTYVMANLALLADELGPRKLRGDPGTPPLDGEQLEQMVAEALEGADRVRQIVRDLRTFSRVDQTETRPVRLRPLLELAIKMVSNKIRYRARLVTEIEDVPPVLGNESGLSQVFLHMLVNAVQAISDGHPESNEIRVRASVAGDAVRVEVTDSGVGIPKDLLHRVFDPFVTTKGAGGGTGLGLSICHGIVTSLGGKIEVESEVGRGTLLRVTLPSAVEASAPAPAPVVEPASPTRTIRLLIVDDEARVTRALARSLKAVCDVTSVTSGPAALEVLRRDDRFHAILCDLMMPGMDGSDLHHWLTQNKPTLTDRMIFMTGGAFTAAARAFIRRIPNRCLEKPLELSVLMDILTQLAATEPPMDAEEPQKPL